MFKNIKSLFILEEETPSTKGSGQQKPTSQQQPAEPSSAPKSTPATSAPQQTSGSGQVTEQFTEILFKALQDNNLQGFDYLEFKQSLRSLEKMPMDEGTRYQSAFAMAQTMGATPAALIQTAEHYLNVLRKEEQKFGEALSAQQQKQIGNKAHEIKQLDEIIQTKTQQIQQLTKEIDEHRQKVVALRKDIDDASVKVESTKNNFIASYQSLVDLISRDVENMKQYLK